MFFLHLNQIANLEYFIVILSIKIQNYRKFLQVFLLIEKAIFKLI